MPGRADPKKLVLHGGFQVVAWSDLITLSSGKGEKDRDSLLSGPAVGGVAAVSLRGGRAEAGMNQHRPRKGWEGHRFKNFSAAGATSRTGLKKKRDIATEAGSDFGKFRI
jgi:hypothetical protein